MNIKKVILFAFVLILAVGLHASRKALIIGNSAYTDAP